MSSKRAATVVGWRWALALALALVLVCAVVVAGAESGGDTDAAAAEAVGSADASGGDDGVEELPNFSKMRVKQLRALLAERGVECKGCAEKSNFVERVRETYHLPLKSAQQASTSAGQEEGTTAAAPDGGASGSDNGQPPSPPPDFDVDAIMEKMRKDQEEKEALLAKLRAQGFNTEGMNMGGFGGFGGFDSQQFDESMKRGKAKGRKARSKQRRKEESARRRKERRRARRERARAAAQEEEVDEHIEL